MVGRQPLVVALVHRSKSRFDPDIYRIINKFLKAGKVRVLALPRP